MQLITTNTVLAAQLSRLIRSYPNIGFAVAWASANTPIFKQIMKRSECIKKAVIGTHFYQTHPDVLDAFVGSKSVRFMLQPKGVFHPKLYVFWNAVRWEALVGSANLTSGALNDNSEVMILLGGRDVKSEGMKSVMLSVIDGYWEGAVQSKESTALAYRSLWERYQPALRRLSGEYGKSKTNKSPIESTVMSMPWSKYMAAVEADVYHGLEKRCELLEIVSDAFARHEHFYLMSPDLRKVVAGLPSDFDSRWGWFGSMKGAGYFHGAVKDNNIHLSQALDHIPRAGHVGRQQYEDYLSEFIKEPLIISRISPLTAS